MIIDSRGPPSPEEEERKEQEAREREEERLREEEERQQLEKDRAEIRRLLKALESDDLMVRDEARGELWVMAGSWSGGVKEIVEAARGFTDEEVLGTVRHIEASFRERRELEEEVNRLKKLLERWELPMDFCPGGCKDLRKMGEIERLRTLRELLIKQAIKRGLLKEEEPPKPPPKPAPPPSEPT